VVLGTPTATPPKWLVDAHPEILAKGRDGQVRGFCSRRHYCFSSEVYLEQAKRITALMATRYGQHPAIVAWQTDNEYGCHDTVVSTSDAAKAAFRRWLAERYGNVQALNAAWGLAFWSQEYRHFDEVEAPFGTVTESHPAHRLDWQRFSSAMVERFNAAQVEILRAASPGRATARRRRARPGRRRVQVPLVVRWTRRRSAAADQSTPPLAPEPLPWAAAIRARSLAIAARSATSPTAEVGAPSAECSSGVSRAAAAAARRPARAASSAVSASALATGGKRAMAMAACSMASSASAMTACP
jgi:hypothetical protein